MSRTVLEVYTLDRDPRFEIELKFPTVTRVFRTAVDEYWSRLWMHMLIKRAIDANGMGSEFSVTLRRIGGGIIERYWQ